MKTSFYNSHLALKYLKPHWAHDHMQDLYSITAALSLLILPISFWKAWRDALWIPVLPFLLLNPLAQSLNLLSSVNSLSLCLSLWGGISSFVNDAGGQGAPEELSAGFYEPSREAATPGERSESWRTTWLTMWLGFEYGACVLNAHRDGYWVLREQKGYGYTYVARTKIAHMALYSIFTIYTGWCMCIIYSYTIISSDLQQ